MDRQYLLAWISYHDGEAEDNARWAQLYPPLAQQYAQEAKGCTQLAQEHEALADYYINLLTGGRK